MKKFLLGLICGLVVVGVANLGHAFLWFGGGGGGGKHRSAGSHGLNGASLFNFNFNQLGADPNACDKNSSNCVADSPGDSFYLSGLGSNLFVGNHDSGGFVGNHDSGGPIFNHFDIDSNSIGNWQSGNSAGTSAPVPEPASMLLFGTGTIVFGGYLRRKLKK